MMGSVGFGVLVVLWRLRVLGVLVALLISEQ